MNILYNHAHRQSATPSRRQINKNKKLKKKAHTYFLTLFLNITNVGLFWSRFVVSRPNSLGLGCCRSNDGVAAAPGGEPTNERLLAQKIRYPRAKTTIKTDKSTDS
ncbi:unnamed protein product [Ceratitis capitata]|uniref:(Mediterranean fruit fly) hypothetical protein n=1 Tax=Ceratitis capitata TaxID=7213 RepID=A0A811UWF7_CERCA|nr:unnamed protein product [Ceratitis capitata]